MARMKILAIDFGTKKIGLALAETNTPIALPLTVLVNDDNFLAKLEQIIKEQQIKKIVLGYPLNIDGSCGAAAKRVEKFAKKLQAKLNLPVILQDERLTSEEAEHSLREARLKKGKEKKVLDAIAASFILRSYLEGKQ